MSRLLWLQALLYLSTSINIMDMLRLLSNYSSALATASGAGLAAATGTLAIATGVVTAPVTVPLAVASGAIALVASLFD